MTTTDENAGADHRTETRRLADAILGPPERIRAVVAPQARPRTAADLLRRCADTEYQPHKTWNSLSTPRPGGLYNLMWSQLIPQADQYPACRGFDTPETRAMRLAADATVHPRYRRLVISATAYTQDPEALEQQQRYQETRSKFTAPAEPPRREPQPDEAAAVSLAAAYGRMRTCRALEQNSHFLDIGQHLIFLGLLGPDADAIAAGLGMLHEAELRLERILDQRQLPAEAPPYRRWRELLEAAPTPVPDYSRRDAAQCAAAIVVWDALDQYRQNPPPHATDDAPSSGHPLKEAAAALHHEHFGNELAPLTRRSARTLAMGREPEFRQSLLDIDRMHQELHRLHQTAEERQPDRQLNREYRQLQQQNNPPELRSWIQEQEAELYEMRPPSGIWPQALWRRAAANFQLAKDPANNGVHPCRQAMLQNAWLLPTIREQQPSGRTP